MRPRTVAVGKYGQELEEIEMKDQNVKYFYIGLYSYLLRLQI